MKKRISQAIIHSTWQSDLTDIQLKYFSSIFKIISVESFEKSDE